MHCFLVFVLFARHYLCLSMVLRGENTDSWLLYLLYNISVVLVFIIIIIVTVFHINFVENWA